jgi:hypothetical protein
VRMDDTDAAASFLGDRDSDVGKVEKKWSLISTEQREHGLSSLRTWPIWFKHAGSRRTLLFGVPSALHGAGSVRIRSGRVLVSLSDEPLDVFGIEFPPQTDGRLAQYKYLVVCTSLILVSVLATMIR